jgi:hypothetical protein
MGVGGVNTSSAQRADPAQPGTEYNKLCAADSAPATEFKRAASETIRERALPHPVGKPFAAPDHDVKRRNLARLVDEDFDPASLF